MKISARIFIIIFLTPFFYLAQNIQYVKAYFPPLIPQDMTAPIYFYVPINVPIKNLNLEIEKEETILLDEIKTYGLTDNETLLLKSKTKETKKFSLIEIQDFNLIQPLNYILIFINLKPTIEKIEPIKIRAIIKDTLNHEIVFKPREIIDYNFDDFDFKFSNDKIYLDDRIYLKIYSSEKHRGKILELKDESKIVISLNPFHNKKNKDLAISFWFSADKIKNIFKFKKNDKYIADINIDNFNLIDLNIRDKSLSTIELNEAFYFDKLWNHCLIIKKDKNNAIEIWINGELAYGLKSDFSNFEICIDKQNFENKKQITDIQYFLVDNNEKLKFMYNRYYRSTKSKIYEGIIKENSNSHFIDKEYVDSIFTLKFEKILISEGKFIAFIKEPEIDAYFSNEYITLRLKSDFIEEFNYVIFEISKDGKNFYIIDKRLLSEDNINNKEVIAKFARENLNKITFFRAKLENKNGEIIYTNVIKVGDFSSINFELKQNYPNPFNAFCSFAVEVFEQDYFIISVYNAVGKLIERIYEGTLSKGIHKFDFNGENLTSGIYFYEVISSAGVKSKKMILAK